MRGVVEITRDEFVELWPTCKFGIFVADMLRDDHPLYYWSDGTIDFVEKPEKHQQKLLNSLFGQEEREKVAKYPDWFCHNIDEEVVA